jgi:hypothetical protein
MGRKKYETQTHRTGKETKGVDRVYRQRRGIEMQTQREYKDTRT